MTNVSALSRAEFFTFPFFFIISISSITSFSFWSCYLPALVHKSLVSCVIHGFYFYWKYVMHVKSSKTHISLLKFGYFVFFLFYFRSMSQLLCFIYSKLLLSAVTAIVVTINLNISCNCVCSLFDTIFVLFCCLENVILFINVCMENEKSICFTTSTADVNVSVHDVRLTLNPLNMK